MLDADLTMLRWLGLVLTLGACSSPPLTSPPVDQERADDRHQDQAGGGSEVSDGAGDRAGESEPPASTRLVRLPLERGEPAVVSEPHSTRGAHPVLVATHGAGGTGEVHCAIWRTIVGSRGFIVCPQGAPMSRRGDAYFYDGHPALGREITLVLEALAQRYGKRVDLEAPVFAGYSQGASMGSRMLPRHAASFAGAVLIEGGFGAYQEWNVASARRFHQQGAKRVLIACGRPSCRKLGQRTAKYMERGGLETRLVYANVGHWFGDALYDEVLANFAWVVEGDPRW